MRRGSALLLIMLLCVPSFAQAQWNNQPSNATVLLDWPFNSIVGPGMSNPYQVGAIATDLSAPISPPNVHKDWISPGSQSGGTELHWNSPNVYSELYVAKAWRNNAQFQCRTTANKMFFVRGPGENGFFGLGCTTGDTGGSIYFGHNSGTLDNSHTCAADLGLICYPNVNQTFIPHGTWTILEVYIKKSTTSTSRDGIVRWWVNGVLQGNYTNMNYAPNGLNEWVWSETWDGTVTNPIPSVEWAHFIDHLRIATCTNCAVGGGGTTPPPPSPTPTPPSPPPATSPGTVSNLSVTPQSSTTAIVSFTAVDDGTGVPAKYDNRLAIGTINWGTASSISSGACASPFAPAGIIGSTVTCLLTGLTPGQSYQMQNVAFRGTMNQGAVYGSLGNIASFTMPSSNVPTITNFVPTTGQAGTSITITGTNFGATIGANTVKCNGQTATITSASPTSLTITAPDGVTTGKISVQTDQGIVYSEQNFTVGAPSNGCGCS